MKRCALGLCIIFLAACSSVVVTEQDYILRPPILPAPGVMVANAPTLSIAAPAVADHVNGLTLVRMDGRVDHLHWSRFAAPVGQIVADWLTELVNASGSVRFALAPGVQGQTDFSLRVRVARFEMEETTAEAGGLRAEVMLEATLLRGNGREVVWTARTRGSIVATDNAPAALVAALGAALQQACETLVGGMLQALQPAPAAAAGATAMLPPR